MITRSVLITEEQDEYLERHSINLSDWLRKRLDKEIKNYGR